METKDELLDAAYKIYRMVLWSNPQEFYLLKLFARDEMEKLEKYKLGED